MSLEMKYFVLKPRSKDAYDVHAQASRKAMRVYANYIEKTDPDFAKELREWVNRESDYDLELCYPEEEVKKKEWKVGDLCRVKRIISPKDAYEKPEGPGWVNDMNKYIGKGGRITYIGYNWIDVYFNDGATWGFLPQDIEER